MKHKLYDYSGFSLKRITEPRFRHALLLLGWVVYFALYFITENLIPAEACTPIHCALDDRIPFNEFFSIFYVGWYFFVFGSLAYYFFTDVESFSKVSIFIMVTQAVAMLCYILFPSRQDLRPTVFERQNIFTALMGFIYSFDTSTGVCPSLHVAYSMGIVSVVLKDKLAKPWVKAAVVFFAVMVCPAVCFVKQHSAVDVFAALPVCLLAEILVYYKTYWKPRLHKRTAAA